MQHGIRRCTAAARLTRHAVGVDVLAQLPLRHVVLPHVNGHNAPARVRWHLGMKAGTGLAPPLTPCWTPPLRAGPASRSMRNIGAWPHHSNTAATGRFCNDRLKLCAVSSKLSTLHTAQSAGASPPGVRRPCVAHNTPRTCPLDDQLVASQRTRETPRMGQQQPSTQRTPPRGPADRRQHAGTLPPGIAFQLQRRCERPGRQP
jgi:hypothetical protein